MLLLQAFLSPVRDCPLAQIAIVALLILILLDWIFGISNALIHHEFSSRKMREGIGHKCSELGFIVVGIVMDAMITSGIDLGFQGPVLTSIALYLCVMEIGSLLETFAKIYPKLAKSPVFKLLASAHVIDVDASAHVIDMENVEESKEEE